MTTALCAPMTSTALPCKILGFFDYFAPDRIQVIGKVEWTYLNNQSPEERQKCFDAFFKFPIPALNPHP